MVSIIIPIYNVAAYLEECVQSALNQTYTNVEVILVDDGSTDESGAICDRFAKADPRVKVVHQPNGGVSDARNAGYKLAGGQFIYFLDSDDWIEETMVECMRTRLLETDSSFLFFDAISFKDGEPPFKNDPYKRHNRYKTGGACDVAMRQLMLDEYKPCVHLNFFKNEFIRRNNLSFKKGIIGEDELFSFYEYCTDERVAYCEERLCHHRIRPGSIMTSTDNTAFKCDSYYVIYNEMLSVWKESAGKKEKMVREFLVRTVKSYMRIFQLLSDEEKATRKEAYQTVCEQVKEYKGFNDPVLHVRMYNKTLGVALSGIRKNARKVIWKLR